MLRRRAIKGHALAENYQGRRRPDLHASVAVPEVLNGGGGGGN